MRCSMLLCLAGLVATASHAAELHIATWNLEWMVSPRTAHDSRLACDAGQRAALPCDVAFELGRDSADYMRLRGYARDLNADVVAFQEVEDEATARRIFPDYDICIAPGAGVQHAGFAVRPDLPHRCLAPLTSLSLNSRHRAGASLQLAPGSAQQVTLLAVHLKSGCAREAIDAATSSCEVLSSQSEVLGEWIQSNLTAGARFVVLGDFNRAGPYASDVFWQRLHVDAPRGLFDVAADRQFRNCYAGQPFTAFIDHILLSPQLVPDLVAGSFRRPGFEPRDVMRYRLSDHCPVSIRLRLKLI